MSFRECFVNQQQNGSNKVSSNNINATKETLQTIQYLNHTDNRGESLIINSSQYNKQKKKPKRCE